VTESPPLFRPARWLPGAHAQTVGARALRPHDAAGLRRERWDAPDGDFLDLDFLDLDGAPARVLILHGLEGSARSGYSLQLFRQLRRRGLASVGLNFRSCSGELNRGLRLYHSGETSDAAWVIDRLRERQPEVRLGAVGISLGGNVLLKYLGERGDSSGLDAAAAWSVPFDLAAGADFMESGVARLYVRRLLQSLRRKVIARADELAAHIDLEGALRARTFREFDDAATAPLHGFEDAADYYRRSSSASFVPAVRTPTLVLHSRDDPFLPADAIPEADLGANPAITPVLTDAGGHVGFVAGSFPWRPHFWAEDLIASWLAKRLLD
jgi:uncharacterized protein